MDLDQRLLRKAYFWSKILGRLPGVRAVFLSGSVAQGLAKETSDIDILVVAKYRRIWVARFLIFSVLKFFEQIATEKDHAGKICPNHFITDHSLEIQEKDAYSAALFSCNIPLYDPDHVFPHLVAANEEWIKSFGERFFEPPAPGFGLPKKTKNLPKLVIEILMKRLQIWKIKKNPDFQIPGAKIILSDTEIRFHPRPKSRNAKVKKLETPPPTHKK